MKIEVGKFYRAKNGDKARIYATDGGRNSQIHGAVLESDGRWVIVWWSKDGKCMHNTWFDLIAEWKEPLDFNPYCLPAWAEWIAMNEGGDWFWFQKEPTVTVSIDEEGVWMPIEAGMMGGIHYEYVPKDYTGDWENSLYKVSDLKTTTK